MFTLLRNAYVPVRVKILIPIALTILLASSAAFIFTASVVNKQHQEVSEGHAVRLANSAERSLRQAMLSGFASQMRAVIEDIHDPIEVPRAALRRPDGSYLVETAKRLSSDRQQKTPNAGDHFVERIKLKDDSRIRVTKSIKNERACYSCHHPSQKTLGYLEVEMSTRWLDIHDRQTLLVLTITPIVALIAIWGVAWLVMNITVLSPVKRLSAAISGVRQGARDIRLDDHLNDELGDLAASFNQMVSDISASEEALVEKEQQLARAEKLVAIGLMAAGVAHEINNPLAAVSMAAQTLKVEGISQEQKEKLTQSIYEGATRIRDIVAELLSLDSRQGLNLNPETPGDILDRALAAVNKPHNVNLVFDIPSNLPKVNVDGHKLSRAIGNIVKNAIQAMPDGGDLTLSAFQKGDKIVFRISDTGHGMDKETARRVFDPFFSTREVGQGFGLGLAMAHSIIAQHNGDVKVKSKPGKGTTFEVMIKLASEEGENA